jgi:dUTP pyrophosphatase
MFMYYLLRLNLPPALPVGLRKMYLDAVEAHNKSIDTCDYFDAGFNLICPTDVEVPGFTTAKIDLGVRGAMEFRTSEYDFAAQTDIQYTMPVGYFLFPRSSTGTKTPLRLANSVGVIDAGYRGNYIAAFDNIRPATFKVEQEQRLVQICPPNLTYPLRVELVEELDLNTVRGAGGFGSTGK